MKQTPTSARAEAARVLARVMNAGESLSGALPPALARIPERDRPLLQALCYGVLRHGPHLEQALKELMQRPLKARDADVRAVLLCGFYQLTHMRVPAHAAVAESVAAVRLLGKPRMTSLVNGVLRAFQRDSEGILVRAGATLRGHYAHPDWLIDAVRRDWPAQWEQVLHANNQPPPMTLRVNLRHTGREAYLASLAAAGIEAGPVDGSESAVQLQTPVDVESLPGFAAGAVSVQDAGAQLAGQLLELAPDMRVLDACAAPGGKTGHLLERAPARMTLVALDIDNGRLQRVNENLQRLNLAAEVVAGDLATPDDWWDGRPFQRILLDAPCSATGVIRRHPDIKYLRRARDIPELAARQRELLAAAWRMLAPGGQLLYVTCSVLQAENREVVDHFLAAHPDAEVMPLPDIAGHPCGPGRQRLPGEQDMDGFFYSGVRKK